MSEQLEIRLELMKRGLTQRQIALYLGLSDSYVSDILRSIRPVGSDILRDIRQAINELSPPNTPTSKSNEL